MLGSSYRSWGSLFGALGWTAGYMLLPVLAYAAPDMRLLESKMNLMNRIFQKQSTLTIYFWVLSIWSFFSIKPAAWFAWDVSYPIFLLIIVQLIYMIYLLVFMGLSAAPFLSLYWLYPESPKWLLSKGKLLFLPPHATIIDNVCRMFRITCVLLNLDFVVVYV